jgi:two-component system NtrC family sensor kinase
MAGGYAKLMQLQTKFIVALIIVFATLAVGIAAMTLNYVNTNTIREAENRVEIYARAAWEIHDGKIARIRSALEILAQDQIIRDFLKDPSDEETATLARSYLEAVRQGQGMDILNVLNSRAIVVLRTRSPYNKGDALLADPMIEKVLSTGQSYSGNIILEMARLDVEGTGLFERCMAVSQDPTGMLSGAAVPVMEGNQLLGILQMGGMLNGAAEKVDKIRDAVFANEYYKGKPLGTATIFMGKVRISTNVLDHQGRRALGTSVSEEVARQVLEQGQSWTGRAFVVDSWYLSQYDPIRDPNDKIIGMLYVGELEQKYLDLRTQAVISQLSVILAGMLLALLIFLLLARSILGPIRQLYQGTTHLTNGNLSYRVEAGTKDEVGSLAVAFNNMAEQLAMQRQELETRQQKQESLSNELRATNHNYMEMLGFVTHELKNPLSSAMMSLYTVKDGYLGELNGAQTKSLESVGKSLDYFHDMIKNYLDLSRLEKGELNVEPSPTALVSEIITPVLQALDRELHEQQMAVENNVPQSLRVNVDPNLIKIVYDNLLSNAIKYGRDGGRILLDSQDGTGRLTLSVLNESEGISAEKMAMLFGKFSRLDTPGYAGKRGSGLGLYICKEIIEKHGGEIWADSKEGEWVKFSFTLPK